MKYRIAHGTLPSLATEASSAYPAIVRRVVRRSREQVAKYAGMLSAMGSEPRLRIMQLLLSADPAGLVVGDVRERLKIPDSTLSHHLEKLKNQDLVHIHRERTFLRCTANTNALRDLLSFLYSECCAPAALVKHEGNGSDQKERRGKSSRRVAATAHPAARILGFPSFEMGDR